MEEEVKKIEEVQKVEVWIGQASPTQIQMWKKQYGKIFEFQVEDSVCYLKRPHRNALEAAMSFAASDPLKYAKTILDNCWIFGDENIKEDGAKFMNVVEKMECVTKVTHSCVKEL